MSLASLGVRGVAGRITFNFDSCKTQEAILECGVMMSSLIFIFRLCITFKTAFVYAILIAILINWAEIKM